MNRNKIIWELLTNPEGVTVDLRGNKIKDKKGYIVSITDNKIKLSDFHKLAVLRKTITELINRDLSLAYVGSWKDDKFMYLDLSLFVSLKNVAVSMAKANKQKAIYNLSNNSVINI